MGMRLPKELEAQILARAAPSQVQPQEAEAVFLSLPWPPSVNHYWRHVVIGKRAQVFISTEGKAYRATVAAMVEQRRPARVPGRLHVRILCYPPDRRTRDLDNLTKSLLDSLVHAEVIEDDSFIDELSIVRGKVEKGGRVFVTISTREA